MWYVITYPKLYVYARISSYLTKSFQKITEKLWKMEWYHQYFKKIVKKHVKQMYTIMAILN